MARFSNSSRKRSRSRHDIADLDEAQSQTKKRFQRDTSDARERTRPLSSSSSLGRPGPITEALWVLSGRAHGAGCSDLGAPCESTQSTWMLCRIRDRAGRASGRGSLYLSSRSLRLRALTIASSVSNASSCLDYCVNTCLCICCEPFGFTRSSPRPH
jgi:hypothetical protein